MANTTAQRTQTHRGRPAAATQDIREELALHGFDPSSREHVQQLTRLYEDYLVEDWQRTGNAPLGIPVAFFLGTVTLWDGPAMVAFCSVDMTRDAVELIYVAPSHRGRGLADTVYRDLKGWKPRLHVKGPVSPAGRTLAERAGLPIDESDPDHAEHSAAVDAELHRTLATICRHKHGKPGRGCNRCYRTAMARTAHNIVNQYVVACDLVARGLAVLV